MAEVFDVVVIGAGPAGYVCAIRAAQLGLKTACVENGSYEGGLGGTCLNWGCIPAKALLESAALAETLKSHGDEMGVRPVEVEYDMGAAVDRSRFISEKLTKGIGFLFKKNEVEHVVGTGRITAPGKVEVTPDEGDPQTLEAKNIVIATGAVMKSFPGFEIDGEKVIGSREALALRSPPERMVVVGAGYVGVEFADVFNAFGVEVTLVEALDSVVPLADAEIGKTLARSFKKRGMTIRTGTKVKSLDRDSSPMILTVETDKGEETIETDVVLMAVGRSPMTEGLGLDAVGVEMNGPWVKIDEWCASSVPGIYAIGDVAGEPMLAHKGSHEGIVAAEKIAGVAEHPMRYDNIPSVGYCHPEVATIGMTEEEAAEAGYEVKVGKYPLTAHGRALTAAHNEGFVKIVADAKYGEVLGVHMIGHNVSELIGEAGLARALESTVEEIAAHAHAHPSMAEAVMEAAMAAMDRAIHM
ncbi:MAG: dihydrolipoyl dehydrogenase [marine benthic group bacterium]|jgi:dihydrolipoamide dehydrogenase|nr:dihydrolipoyl dehydrogenase [Gemmatimonadota bacterium]MCL7958151.1 dihydrolipoyl dehydrogenase [Gemmatimonadota bacterium]MCL7965884.1 dihydrolipoyl dehydrogenase [Gemmatimonadota bacterium]MCL7982057.1 dihydrolipoyl dehydrogenase [Gemmatimonadota bacterium]